MDDARPTPPPGSTERTDRLDELIADLLEAQDRGENVHDWIERHPEHRAALRSFLSTHDDVGRVASDLHRLGAPPEIAACRKVRDYDVEGEIARGGMGVVNRARHARLQRVDALKMVRGGGLATEEDVRRFRREMHAVAAIDHPNIVPIFTVGEHEGVPYFSMRLIEGGSLHTRKHEFQEPRRAARLLRKIARALAAAHERGIVHRDLKPANILLDEGGEPFVTDFGLAKALDEDSSLTRTHSTLGTPSYMSPEQASGHPETVGVASDIYSLGAILYELLTGQPPFAAASSLEVLRKVVEDDPRAPRTLIQKIPRDLETICLRCLQKAPERRYATMIELASELTRFLENRPVLARKVGRPERLWRWCRRNPAAVTILGLLLSSAVGSTLAALKIRSERNNALVNLTRAENAEEQTKLGLRESLLSQAQAQRLSGRQGQHIRSLAVLERAAKIAPDLRLRNEAAAALTLIDLDMEFPIAKPNPLYYVALDPTHRYFALGTDGGRVEVRDRTTLEAVITLHGAEATRATHLAFDPGGRILVARLEASREENALYCWDWREGRLIHRIDVSGLSFATGISRSGLLALGTHGDEAILVDLATGETVDRIPTPQPPQRFFFSHDGRFLAITFWDLYVQVVDLETSRSHLLHHPGNVLSAGFHPRSYELVTGCFNREVHLWDAESGTRLGVLRGHEGSVVGADFLQGGRLIVSTSYDSTLRIWDRGSLKQRLVAPYQVQSFQQVSDDGEGIGPLGGNEYVGSARILRTDVHHTLPEEKSLRANVLLFDPDLRLLFVGDFDGLSIWDLRTERKLAYLPIGLTYSIALSPDHRRLLTCGPSGIFEWPLSGISPPETSVHVGPPREIHRSPGEILQRVTTDRSWTRFWVNLRSARFYGKAVGLLAGDPLSEVLRFEHRGVHDLAVSPDGRWLLTAPWNGNDIRLWDTSDPEAPPRILHEGLINARVGFSPSGDRFVLTTQVGSELWDTETCRPVLSFAREEAGTAGFWAISPDERLLAFQASNRTVTVLDSSTGNEIVRLSAAGVQPINYLAFTPDSRSLVAAEFTVHFWDLVRLREHLAELGLAWDPILAADSRDPVAPVPVRELSVELGRFEDPRWWPQEAAKDSDDWAMRRLEQRLEKDPGDLDARRRKAQLHARLDHPLRAADGFGALLELEGESAAVHLARGEQLKRAGVWDEAIRSYSAVLAEQPEEVTALLGRGYARARNGEMEAAIDDLEALLELAPRTRLALRHLANLLLARADGEPELARGLALIDTCLDIAPYDPEALWIRGAFLYRLGRLPEATRTLEAACKNQPEGGRTKDLHLLALCYYSEGRKEEALALYERAVAPPEEPWGIRDGLDPPAFLRDELQRKLEEKP